MERRSPFVLATVSVGIFAITGAPFLNAAATTETSPGESGEDLAQRALWLFAAAGVAFLPGIGAGAARAGWRFWSEPEPEEASGEA